MADTLVDLPSIVHSHCLFFDALVELIPPKFYIPNEDAHDSWTYNKSKAAKAAARIQTKENLKKAKRDRLDPDKFKSTLQVLQEQKVETEKADPEVKAPSTAPVNRAVTYEELRERLHKRISMLRSKRHADAAAAATMSARTFQNEKKKESLKRRLKTAPKDLESPGDGSDQDEPSSKPVSKEEQPHTKRQKKVTGTIPNRSKKDLGGMDQLEFSRVKMGLDNSITGNKRRRKESKEQLLQKAVELQENMQDPEKGQEIISQHSWTAAVSRAAGEKVLDNPKLLKKSMKREKQQTVKSAKKWKERKDYEKKGMSEKQRNRKENITKRLDSIKERKIAKREKKLMRPGFEGRKAGFINT